MADAEAAKKFPELKKVIIQVGYLYEKVSNCKKTAFIGKICQEKSLISIEERQAKVCKALKDRLPVLLLNPLVTLSLGLSVQALSRVRLFATP